MREELSAGGVVIRASAAGDQVLLGQQTDRNTGARTHRLPKGHVEAAETLEQAALREVLEETGYTATIRERLEDVRYEFTNQPNGDRVRKRVVFFLMEPAQSATDSSEGPQPRDGELDRVLWSPVDRALELLSFEIERGVLREALARRSAQGTL